MESGIILTGVFTGEEAGVGGEDGEGEGVAGMVVGGGVTQFLFISPAACIESFFAVEKLGKPAGSTPSSLYKGVVPNTASVDRDSSIHSEEMNIQWT